MQTFQKARPFFYAKKFYFLVDYKERRRPLRLTFHLSFIFFLETISTTTTMTDEICMFSFCSFGNHAQAHAQVGWDFKFKCQIVFSLSFFFFFFNNALLSHEHYLKQDMEQCNIFKMSVVAHFSCKQ